MQTRALRAGDIEAEPLLILEAAIELIERNHPEVFALSAVMHIEGHRNPNLVYWDERRAAEKVLAAYEQEGLLSCRSATTSRFYSFASLEAMNEARVRLGRLPAPRTCVAAEKRDSEAEPVSAQAQKLLAVLLGAYDHDCFEVEEAALKKAVRLRENSWHKAIMELIPTGLFDHSAPGGVAVYWLPDPAAVRLVLSTTAASSSAKLESERTRWPRLRPSALASCRWS